MLDAYTRVYVYYTLTDDDTHQFPPPQDSALRQRVNKCKAKNHVAPRLCFMKQDSPEARYFDALLLDDHAYKGFNYSEFEEKVHQAALEEVGLAH